MAFSIDALIDGGFVFVLFLDWRVRISLSCAHRQRNARAPFKELPDPANGQTVRLI